MQLSLGLIIGLTLSIVIAALLIWWQIKSFQKLRRFYYLGLASGELIHEMSSWVMLLTGRVNRLQKLAKMSSHFLTLSPEIEKIENLTNKIEKQLYRARRICRDDMIHEDGKPQYNLTKEILEVIEFCSERLDRFQVELRFVKTDEDVIAKGHSWELSQILLNLINNSLRAVQNLDQRWIEINLKTDLKLKKATLLVRDSQSLNAKTKALDSSESIYTQILPSMGMGLLISKQLALEQGGKLKIEENKNGFHHVQVELELSEDS